MIPKLRFPEFTGEWQKKKLGELTKVSSGGTPSRTKHAFWNGDIPWITTSDINFNQIGSANQFITDEGLNGSSAKLFPKNTILMALYGQGKTRGKVAILNIEASTNQACAAILPSKNFNSRFLFQDLKRRYTALRELSNDGSQKNLSGQLVKSLVIHTPSIEEQEKIAEFLTAVDERVALQDKKVELLKKYKKSVMKKIFSQEVRFKNENGNDYPDWQEKKLGKIFECSKGSGLSIGDLSIEGARKCILYGQLYTKYPEVISEIISRTNSHKGLVSKKNDLLLPCSTTTTGIDLANAAALNEEGVLLGGDISVLRFKNDGSNVFYAYYFTHHKKHKIAAYGQGSTIVHLYYSHFKNMNIEVPAVEEQHNIANFLIALDGKISIEKAKLTEARRFKKALLQRMFV